MLSSTISSDWFLLLSRLILGAIMIRYGWPMIKDLKKNAQDFNKMGYKPGIFWGTPLALLEFFGGFAIIIGIFPNIVAALFGFMMLVGSVWKLKTKTFGSASYDMVLMIQCLLILYFGAGPGVFINYELPMLRWDALIVIVIAALIQGFLPEILGEKYRNWNP